MDTSKWIDPCKDPEDVRNEFDRISKNYDEDLLKKGYRAPEDTAEMLADLIPLETGILDAGCGTGLVGLYLNRRGFQNITGLDFSGECLKEAGGKKVYTDLVNSSLTEKLPFDDHTFGAVTCIGVFSRFGKAEILAILNEFSRICRKDGIILFTYREDWMKASNLLDDLKKHPQLVIEQLTEPVPIFTVDEEFSVKPLFKRFQRFEKSLYGLKRPIFESESV